MAGETVIVSGETPPQETAAPAVTVQETVAAAAAVAAEIRETAEVLNRDDPVTEARIMGLENRIGEMSTQIGTLVGAMDAISNQVTALTVVATAVVEEPPVVETPAVEVVPESTVPPPEAPEVRAKKKRRFL